mmetsp:Transcript_139321/g.347327  ORF Transcript_139321/g.347327 Transcript_139321/m.347327 type:complete len:275 (+) Transcript_139321:1049-1873(+)
MTSPATSRLDFKVALDATELYRVNKVDARVTNSAPLPLISRRTLRATLRIMSRRTKYEVKYWAKAASAKLAWKLEDIDCKIKTSVAATQNIENKMEMAGKMRSSLLRTMGRPNSSNNCSTLQTHRTIAIVLARSPLRASGCALLHSLTCAMRSLIMIPTAQKHTQAISPRSTRAKVLETAICTKAKVRCDIFDLGNMRSREAAGTVSRIGQYTAKANAIHDVDNKRHATYQRILLIEQLLCPRSNNEKRPSAWLTTSKVPTEASSAKSSARPFG